MNQSENQQSGMTGELRSDAHHLGSKTKDRIHSEIDSRKETAASEAKSVSSAMERTAGELGPDSPEWLKSTIRQAAAQVQRFADSIEQKDSRQIFNDVRTFARENPTTFLAVCAAAGFAAARLFKAGEPQTTAGTSPQNQGPPPRVDEPMFGNTGGQSVRATTRGEFV